MEPFRFYTSGDAAYSFAGRLSFPQLLLVLSCVLVESSLPARLGDRRQLQDLVSRHEKNWLPCVGPEGFHEMKQNDWQTVTPEIHRLWEEVRGCMVQQRLCGVTTSSEDLREHLCRLLCRIEQISAQGWNALCTPRPNLLSPRVLLDDRASLVLVCLSLSVVSSPRRDARLMWEPDGRILDEMLLYLHESPLFPCGISSEQLMSALSSLEMLFSCEDDYVNRSVAGSRAPERSQTPGAESEKRNFRMVRYDYFSIQKSGNILWCGVVGQNNYTEVDLGIGYAGEVSSAERQKPSSLNWI